jgi:hypothetical protein
LTDVSFGFGEKFQKSAGAGAFAGVEGFGVVSLLGESLWSSISKSM